MELALYKPMYKIVFKEEGITDKIISDGQYTTIKAKLFKNEWIEVDNELYNPFEIKKIVKFQVQDGISQRLQKEDGEIQSKVKEYMRYYKKDISLGILENMINKRKGIE